MSISLIEFSKFDNFSPPPPSISATRLERALETLDGLA